MSEPSAGWPGLEQLLELTERALEVGLDDALATVRTALGDAVEQPPVAQALGTAIASAQRALAARDATSADVDALRSLAQTDDLTGVLTRRAFFDRLEEELARAQRGSHPVTLVLCDLDDLKAINDASGHPAGDAALRSIAQLLAASVRQSDCVGRIGGDEFGVLLVGADGSGAERLLKRLRASGTGEAKASFGAARAPDDGTTREALVAVADRRLYEEKRR